VGLRADRSIATMRARDGAPAPRLSFFEVR
jgi:hypothetical protein